jgi:ribosomal protein L34E
MNDISFKRQMAAYYHDKFPDRSSIDIGKELGYSEQWVRKWWNKNSCNTEDFHDGRKDREMKSNSKITRSMKQIIKRNMHGIKKVRGSYYRKLSQRKMVKKLNNQYGFNVSRQVVQTVLKESKLHYVFRPQKIRLIQDHMERRLKFAKVMFWRYFMFENIKISFLVGSET